MVYGRTRNAYRHGRRIKVSPEVAPVMVAAPSLRIVSDELWQAAHPRLDRTRQPYLRRIGGKLWGRPESGIESRRLAPGGGRPADRAIPPGWAARSACS